MLYPSIRNRFVLAPFQAASKARRVGFIRLRLTCNEKKLNLYWIKSAYLALLEQCNAGAMPARCHYLTKHKLCRENDVSDKEACRATPPFAKRLRGSD